MPERARIAQDAIRTLKRSLEKPWQAGAGIVGEKFSKTPRRGDLAAKKRQSRIESGKNCGVESKDLVDQGLHQALFAVVERRAIKLTKYLVALAEPILQPRWFQLDVGDHLDATGDDSFKIFNDCTHQAPRERFSYVDRRPLLPSPT